MPASSDFRQRAQPELDRRNAPPDSVVPRRINVNRGAVLQPASLTPGEDLMFGCVLNDEECCAVRDSWRTSFPIVVLNSIEPHELANRNPLVFSRSTAGRVEHK